MRSFVVFAVALLASSVSAAVTGSQVEQFLRRQAGATIPADNSECADACGPLSQALKDCAADNIQASKDSNGTATVDPLKCTCSDTIASAYQACFQCDVSHGTASQGAVQEGIQALTKTCQDGGHPFSNPPTIAADTGSGSGGGSGSGDSGKNGAAPSTTLHAAVIAVVMSGVASFFMI